MREPSLLTKKDVKMRKHWEQLAFSPKESKILAELNTVLKKYHLKIKSVGNDKSYRMLFIIEA